MREVVSSRTKECCQAVMFPGAGVRPGIGVTAFRQLREGEGAMRTTRPENSFIICQGRECWPHTCSSVRKVEGNKDVEFYCTRFQCRIDISGDLVVME